MLYTHVAESPIVLVIAKPSPSCNMIGLFSDKKSCCIPLNSPAAVDTLALAIENMSANSATSAPPICIVALGSGAVVSSLPYDVNGCKIPSETCDIRVPRNAGVAPESFVSTIDRLTFSILINLSDPTGLKICMITRASTPDRLSAMLNEYFCIVVDIMN